MSKDLKKLAKKYNSLSTSEKIAVEGAVRGEIMDEWFSNRPQAMNILINTSWFHLENLDFEVGNDERLRLKRGVVTEVPKGESKNNLKYAGDFISDYFSLVAKPLNDPAKVGQDGSTHDSSNGWGEEEFLLGLLGPDRGGDSG